MIRCTDLRCERLVDPLGVGTSTPRLTWRVEADGGETDVEQRGVDVETDTGWSHSHEGWRQQGRYDGAALASRRAVRWRVRARTSVGTTEWSDWASFELGVLDPSAWTATMITADGPSAVVRFTKVVAAPEDVVRARLRLTAHGIVTFAIDGTDVTDDVLLPGWT